MIADLGVAPSQALALATGGCLRHDSVERTIEAAAVFAPCALGQVMATPGKHDSAQQQCLHTRGEHGVAGLDGVGAVAELMHDPYAIDAVRFTVSLPFAGAGPALLRRRRDALSLS